MALREGAQAKTTRDARGPGVLKALRELARGEPALELEHTNAAMALSARLKYVRPAVDPEDIEKPWY